jgi:hypothetical protein
VSETRTPNGPKFIGMSHDIADRNLRHYQEALKSGRGNPVICREMIDKWLEYRKGPNERRYL